MKPTKLFLFISLFAIYLLAACTGPAPKLTVESNAAPVLAETTHALPDEPAAAEADLFLPVVTVEAANSITIPDTGQDACYDVDGRQISCPTASESLFGQDANYVSNAPAFQDNGEIGRAHV